MKIKVARILGYCLGVRRAMDTAFQCLAQRDPKVYSHGELIHNGPALEMLAQKGLKTWSGEKDGSVIIRAHGLPPDQLATLNELAGQGLKISDATCPRVLRVQKLVSREAARGRQIIIWGKADHPEVVGLVGHGHGCGQVISEAADVAHLPEAQEVLLVSQTTQDLAKWPEIEAAVLARWPQALIKNTICEATVARQAAVRHLAGEVEVLVIIGGRNSGNTKRLADIGRQMGRRTFLVETPADLNLADYDGVASVGVAAGASTSIWQITQVLQALETMARSRSDLGYFWPRLLRVLVLSGLFAALGLAALALGVETLMGQAFQPLHYSFFFFLIAGLHLFRDFSQDRGASQRQILRFKDPDRMAFLVKYRKQLIVFALVSSLAAMLAATLANPKLLLFFAAVWAAALVHQFVPRPQGQTGLIRALLGPALLALGWGAFMVGVAWVEKPWPPAGPQLLTGLWAGGAAFGHVFVLALMGDVLAVQGDRIFGRPTLPTIFGEKTTRNILSGFLIAWAIWLNLGWLMGFLPPLAGLLTISGPLYNHFILTSLLPKAKNCDPNSDHIEGLPALHGFQFEALMYGQLILTGLLTLWNI